MMNFKGVLCEVQRFCLGAKGEKRRRERMKERGNSESRLEVVTPS